MDTINEILYSSISINLNSYETKKGKVFPYSLPSVGPGADPGVQASQPAGDVK